MVARQDLLAPAGEQFAERVADLASPGMTSRTKATGVVHLGDASDVTWGDGNSLKDVLTPSGWQPHGGTLNSGVVVANPIEWFLQSGVVYWRGRMYKSAGWGLGWNTVVSGLPGSVRPASNAPLTVSIDPYDDIDPRACSVLVTAAGELVFVAQAHTATSWPLFGGSYHI